MPEDCLQGDALTNALEGLQCVQPATGNPGMSIIDSLKNHLDIKDPVHEVSAPAVKNTFDLSSM